MPLSHLLATTPSPTWPVAGGQRGEISVRQGVGDLVRSPSSCSAPPPLVFVQALTVDISESSNLQSPGGLHTALAAIIPETKRDRQADYLGLYFFSWEQRKALNELASREGLTGQSPQCAALLPLPRCRDPIAHPSVTPCSAAKPQGKARIFLKAGLPWGSPALSHATSHLGLAWPGPNWRSHPPGARHLCASGYTARLEGRWLPGSHPGLRGCVPPGLAPSQGQLPSIWCPWPAPSAGQVLLSGPHKTPLSAFPRLPRGFPSPGRARASPSPAGQWLSQPGTATSSSGCPRGCCPHSPCPPAVPSPAGWAVPPGR